MYGSAFKDSRDVISVSKLRCQSIQVNSRKLIKQIFRKEILCCYSAVFGTYPKCLPHLFQVIEVF
jgi:hypothetical protein